MCTQFVPLEGAGVSSIKVGMMSFSLIIFLFKVPYISKVFFWGLLYWLFCYFSALFNDEMRFSTIGYLGMFILGFIVYYNLLFKETFTLGYFVSLLRGLIMIYGIVLVLQQLSMLVGIHSLWIINLDNQAFLSLTKLPSLTIEPSHSARLLTVMMLGYFRCWELEHEKQKINLQTLFNVKNRWLTIIFLWTMCTMGSGTAFIGLAILSLYFIQRNTAIYILSILCLLVYLGQVLEIEQMNRAVKISKAMVTSGSVKEVQEADGSGASRIIPLINTITKTDLMDKTTWFGKGTEKKDKLWWLRTDIKLSTIEQYGLLTFIISLIFVYNCMIRRIFSLETLIFIILLGCSLRNIYYVWGAMIIFATVRYFQVIEEKGLLEINIDNKND